MESPETHSIELLEELRLDITKSILMMRLQALDQGHNTNFALPLTQCILPKQKETLF